MTEFARRLTSPAPADTIEFYTVELTPLADSGVFVTITATLCPREGELTTRDLVCKRTDSLDAALTYIRRVIIRS